MASKKHLMLNIDSEVAEKAVADPDIQVSELTEKFLRAFTTSSKTENNEKRYKGYQELFKLMLPLLRKFKVETEVGVVIIDREPSEDPEWEPEFDPDGNVINDDPIPSEWYNIFLRPDGKLEHDAVGEIKIKDEPIGVYHRPQDIIDNLLNSIQEGVNYHKEQFKEIEMAKTIIDVITKGVIPKTKGKGKKKWK